MLLFFTIYISNYVFGAPPLRLPDTATGEIGIANPLDLEKRSPAPRSAPEISDANTEYADDDVQYIHAQQHTVENVIIPAAWEIVKRARKIGGTIVGWGRRPESGKIARKTGEKGEEVLDAANNLQDKLQDLRDSAIKYQNLAFEYLGQTTKDDFSKARHDFMSARSAVFEETKVALRAVAEAHDAHYMVLGNAPYE